MDKILNELHIMKQTLDNLPVIDISIYDLNKTDIFIVDINNGFAKQGSLYSPRIESLISPIHNLLLSVGDKVNSITAFTDCHNSDSIELESFPTHCLRGDLESEIVDELKSFNNINVVEKNSTNGFFALKDTSFNNVDNIIVVGDCTDICIYQFAITLKSYFNHNNIKKNIIVPINLVDTYDIPNIHPAELLNTVFLNSMIQNGINVVKGISYQ